MILRHLGMFLDGPLENQVWCRDFQRAEQGQMADDRVNRVWKFFEPEPVAPRTRLPQPPIIPVTTWVQAVAATGVFAAAAIHLGYLLIKEPRIPAIAAYLASLIGGYVGARNAAEWHHRTERLRAKDLEYRSPQRRRVSAPPDGFAKQVDRQFDHYFATYVPRGVERSAWLAATAGVRRSLRDEIVEIYREQRVGVGKISWLIRYLVSDVKVRWQNGTLWDYREELATPLRTKAVTVLGIATIAVGGIGTVGGAVRASPLSAAISMTLALLAGWIAARAWLHVGLERRRFAADTSENARASEKRRAAFRRWQARLADKPEDQEMAAWLDCDRRVLLDEALRHYKLTMSDIIAHAFIEGPAKPTAHARLHDGPWRYLRYRLVVFLLTTDGVRQLDVKLDFQRGIFRDRRRTNYRYDAVAAVRVSQSDDYAQKFELALVNGDDISVPVIDLGMEELQQDENPADENPAVVFEATLETSGIHHTLHVLEGIAAEGKEWISQERRRGEVRTRILRPSGRSRCPETRAPPAGVFATAQRTLGSRPSRAPNGRIAMAVVPEPAGADAHGSADGQERLSKNSATFRCR